MKAGAFTDEAVVELAKKFEAVMIDIDQHKDLRLKYAVSVIPDVRFLNPDDTPIATLGSQDARGVAAEMKEALKNVRLSTMTP